MAKISKNGNLSGAVGNLVFVNSDHYQYVRSKPTRIKQSQKSKEAASVFGWVSGQDKKYRAALTDAFAMGTDRYYAARHRTRMFKTLSNSTETNKPSLTHGTPEALIGFDFNEAMPWSNSFHGYPQFNLDPTGTVECKIPMLLLGDQIKLPKGAISAVLELHTFSTDPDQQTVQLNKIDSLVLNLAPKITVPETVWSFDIPDQNAWLMVIGLLNFGYPANIQTPPLSNSAAYLWTKAISKK